MDPLVMTGSKDIAKAIDADTEHLSEKRTYQDRRTLYPTRWQNENQWQSLNDVNNEHDACWSYSQLL